MKIKRTKLLTAVVIVLLLLNITTLTVILMNKQGGTGRPMPEGPRKMIIERLHFDDEQVKAFDVLVEEHRQQMRELREKIAKNKEAFYDQLKQDDTDTATAYTQIASITRFEEEAERITFNHFKKVRALCNDEQKQQFDLVIRDILKNMTAPHERPHGPMDRPPGGPPVH